MSRPEEMLPPELYYSPAQSLKYSTSSRLATVQSALTHRALALLALPTPSLILDLGCGTGLSGTILSAQPPAVGGPHTWIGIDIAPAMLAAALARDVAGDLLLADLGAAGIPFRPATFDAAISISAIQWLCNADATTASVSARLARFFATLFASLRRGGRAVCQFYPRDTLQREMICRAAVRAGFGAGLLEDDPGTKNCKLFLVLTVGGEGNGDITGVVEGWEGVEVLDERRGRRGGDAAEQRTDRRRKKSKKTKTGERKGGKAWILRKKEQMERKGMIVKASSKYTGRKRGPVF